MIHLDAPNIGRLEKQYLAKAIDNGFVSTVGPLIPEFEDAFAGFVRVKKAVSTQSGTSALHMALYELGIGFGDEVIVPALTFVASVNPVIYVGAKPVFADVDIDTWNISPSDIERKITKRTKAIIPVHLYGNPCDMDAILRIAGKHGLYVIEDACPALGAKYRRQYVGTIGDMGCFSFNGNKIITTGGGGMVVSRNGTQIEHIRFLINQAKDRSRGWLHPEVGFNYRMTNIEAALGLAQIKRLPAFLSIKKKINTLYRKLLKDPEYIVFQERYRFAESSDWLTCIYFDRAIDIDRLRNGLTALGIETRRVFSPLVELPPYRKYRKGTYPNASKIYKNGLCLPSSTLNGVEDIQYAVTKLKAQLRRY